MSTENKWFAMSRKTDAEGAKSSDAEISIYDNIGGWGISANEFIDELKGLGDDVETINLRIASGGGSIVEGNTIYNALKRHSARVVTHIDSLAASMASVIAMAGDEIRMAENALFMIHNPWTMSMGDADQLRKDADLLDKMEASIRTSYARSNLSADEIDAAMDAETYYTAEEALEAGFIDFIDGANLAAASIGDMETIKGFENIPQGKIDAIKMECQARQIETLNAKLNDRNDQIEKLNAALIEANESNEVAKGLLAKADEEAKNVAIAHAADLEAAKRVHDSEVSAKAAEMLQADGTPPVESHPEGKVAKMTPEEFWDRYDEFSRAGDLNGKNLFYAENKHVIGK